MDSPVADLCSAQATSVERCLALYEEFRPEIPAGKKGWGVAGGLDLELIERMAT